jgi:hypothetical protein
MQSSPFEKAPSLLLAQSRCRASRPSEPDVADAPECATERHALPLNARDLSITNAASRRSPDRPRVGFTGWLQLRKDGSLLRQFRRG